MPKEKSGDKRRSKSESIKQYYYMVHLIEPYSYPNAYMPISWHFIFFMYIATFLEAHLVPHGVLTYDPENR